MGDKSPKSKRKHDSQKQAKIHKMEQKAADDARPTPPAPPAEGSRRNGSSSKH